MKDLKIRASAFGRVAASIDKPEKLPVGAQSYLHELFLQNEYGRRSSVISDEMSKGIECEEDSLTLLTDVTRRLYLKNEKNFEDDFFTGTPDAFSEDEVVDVKTPFTLSTFHQPSDTVFTKSGLLTSYGWQLMVYMHLTGKKKARLVYCLVNTPEWILNGKLYSLTYKFIGGEQSPEYEEHESMIRMMHTFDDIEKEKRVKQFTLEYDENMIEAAKIRVEACRKYYKKITL